VVRSHDFNFEAAPFINLKASVDILPVIVKFLRSWWSQPFNAFFDWVKQKYGELAGKDQIEAGISFKVSIDGGLGAKFSHKRDENENTTIEGEPVTSKITIKAEGEAKMDGHIYVVKVEVLLKAGVESSMEIGMSIGSDSADKEPAAEQSKQTDDSAPYIALDFMFNGVKVYLEREVQVSLDKKTKRKSNLQDGFFEAEPSVKEAERFERTWLKMSDKHQFKYYLDSDDQEDITPKT